jgi:hypothetical protein
MHEAFMASRMNAVKALKTGEFPAPQLRMIGYVAHEPLTGLLKLSTTVLNGRPAVLKYPS